MTSEMVTADRDRGFADWGATVVLRRVTQSFDPETGVLSETYDDRDVTAIAGEAGLAAIGGTAGNAGRFLQMFLVRSEDVENEGDLRGLRIVYFGEQLRVDDAESWSQARMVLLKCGRV